MAICILSNVEFVVKWKERINCCFLNGILYVIMQVIKRLKILLGLMWKKGIGIIQNMVRHAKNKKLFASHNCEYVATQSANGVVGEKARKVMQFVTLLHLL